MYNFRLLRKIHRLGGAIHSHFNVLPNYHDYTTMVPKL